jgi:DNA-binding CsgD family transcriptional regulator
MWQIDLHPMAAALHDPPRLQATRASTPAAGEVETRRLVINGVELVVLSLPPPAVAPELPAELSAAEREVVHWLLRGKSNAQVAAKRRTAVRTAANQVASIFRKIGVGSRAELVARLSS